MTDKVPILVVLGIDVDGKPHGSRFEERDAPFVERAAELMGFHAIHVAADNGELHGIAEQLPLALGEDGDIRRGRRRDLLYAACRVVNPRYLRPSSRVCW